MPTTNIRLRDVQHATQWKAPSGVRWELPRHSIPELCDISQGFDAILQFREDLLEQRASFFRFAEYSAPVVAILPPATTLNELAAVASSATYREPLFIPGSGLVQHPVEFDAVGIRLGISVSGLELRAGTSLDCDLRLQIAFSAELQETDESWRVRRSNRHPVYGDVVERRRTTVPFTWKEITATGRLTLVKNDGTSEFGVRLALSGIGTEGTATSAAADELIAEEPVAAHLHTAIVGREIDMTPMTCSIAAGASLLRLDGVDQFDVSIVVTHSNTVGLNTLNLCVSLRSTAAVHPGGVRPFHGAANFGYYVSGAIAETAIQTVWAETPPDLRQIRRRVSVPLVRDDEPFNGEAEVLLRWTDLEGKGFASTPGRSDHLRYRIRTEIELEELWDDAGDPIPIEGELSELQDRHEYPTVLDLHLTGVDSGLSLASSALGTLVGRMTAAVLRPFSPGYSTPLTVVAGTISHPLDGLYLAGDLA